jgi:hypothetical protein
MKAAHMWNEWAMIQGILEGHHTHKQQQLYTFEVETTVEGEIMAIKEATEEMIQGGLYSMSFLKVNPNLLLMPFHPDK